MTEHRSGELTEKLSRVRRMMVANGFEAVHIAGLGNLAWLLCGADLVVSLTDPPVAEAVVTSRAVTVVASNIERGRLETEQLPNGVDLVYTDWFDPESKMRVLEELVGEARVLSDTGAHDWPTRDFWPLRVPLTDKEIERYRRLGRDASEVFSEVLTGVTPGLSEHAIAGRLAEGLRAIGAQPAVLLVGSDERLERYKHPLPTEKRVERRFMAVACARRHGLFANLTRLVSFGEERQEHKRAYTSLLDIERALLDATQHGILVRDWFAVLEDAYRERGFADVWQAHHQGGPTGYLSRDFLATPEGERMLVERSAYAWNPSVPGVKVEDTMLLVGDSVEPLTLDERWPTIEIGGRRRPEVLEL